MFLRNLKGLGPFRIAIAGLLALSLGLNIVVIVKLLDVQAEARPLLNRSDDLVELADQGPYIREELVKVLLALAADELIELAESRIQYTVPISQSIRVATEISLDERISVPVSLVVSDTFPISAEIPLHEEVLVPVRLEIDQVFSVDAKVPFKDEIVVPVDDVIHIDENFETRVLGQDIKIPIRGDIPVKLNVTVPIDKEFPVLADIPVTFPISETFPVEISWLVPIDLQIPINLPIETQVDVPFSRAIPVNLVVPVVLDVPLDISLGDTYLGEVLRDLGQQLRLMSGN